jgi:CheY-like chemotaxis protein
MGTEGITLITVLVVEDEPRIRKLARVNLVARGFRVLEAANGRDGLDQIRAERPSVVLLDVRLPDITGWEVLETVQMEPEICDTPVVIMTASAMYGSEIDNEYHNLFRILSKPLDIRELVQVVHDAARNKTS